VVDAGDSGGATAGRRHARASCATGELAGHLSAAT
jgi:hypothetical protein